MIKLLPILCLTLLAVGCRSTYDITLNNGTRITGVGKPELDKEKAYYVFKDPTGKENKIPAMRVRIIEPHQEKDTFYNSTQPRLTK